MADITGKDVLEAFDRGMDETTGIMPRVLSVLIQQVSFRPTGNLGSQTNTTREGNVIKSGSNAFYWRWWLEGRGAVVPVRAKYLHFFSDGGEVFTKYVKPFKGHKDTVEPLYEENITRILDNELDKAFREI